MAGQKKRYGYREYRGRGSGRSVLIFIIVLLAVLFIAGVVFMVVMGDYINYTPNGMEINWPWLDQESSDQPVFSDPVVIVTDGIGVPGDPGDPGDSVYSPVPGVSYGTLAAVTVTSGQLRNGKAAQAVVTAGGNTLVVEMKTGAGKLAWQSRTEMAASLEVNAAHNGVADAIRELARDGNLYLVARVHCFKDPVLAGAGIGPLMTRQGQVWLDSYGSSWSSPASQQAADYLSALCQELADMGFDEILLDDVGYPCLGEVDTLATDSNCPEDRTAPVAAFLQRIAGELREKDVRLSVYVYEALTSGDAVYSGMTATVLARNAGRVWLDRNVDREYYESILTAAGLDNLPTRVVAHAANAVEGGSWYQ